MYAVVKYFNYRKEQSFEIIYVTHVLEYAKQVAYNFCLENAGAGKICITNRIDEYDLYPENIIINYAAADTETDIETGKEVVNGISSTVYGVVKVKNQEPKTIVIIDDNFICNKTVWD